MKKKRTSQLEIIEESENQIAQIIPIRTETVLSQYPLHRLSKDCQPLQVCFTKTNEKGKVTTTWKVSPNPEYGEPGILAYKLDTLVINRRIDELRRDIPELLCIGSWTEIQELLGVRTRNLKALKNAFSQNAGALIIAKLEYAGKDGRNRVIELRSTRYGVIFIGEQLPDGTKADAVYVALNPAFREVIRNAKTRPLDYEYLKALPPASQRLYELISYQIFAALKHGNPRAKYLYSDICKYAPLTRYYEWEKVKKQLYKIHHPHKASGYIKAIDYEYTQDDQGQADWIIWYTPGRKAKSEFAEFTTRKEKQITFVQPVRPQLFEAMQALSEEGREADTPAALARTAQDSLLIEKLMSFGIDENRTIRLIEKDRAECEVWADAWLHQNQKGMDNPPAVLIRFIETKRRPLPKGYKEAKERDEKRKQAELAQQRQRAEDDYFKFFEPAFRAFQQRELDAIQGKKPKAFALFKEWLDKNHARGLRMVKSEKRREEITIERAEYFFGDIHPELEVTFTTFAKWDKKHNPESCDPIENQLRIFEALVKRVDELT